MTSNKIHWFFQSGVEARCWVKGPPKIQNISIIWSKTLVGVLKFNSGPLQNILGPPQYELYI